jgi:hypothetical protein
MCNLFQDLHIIAIIAIEPIDLQITMVPEPYSIEAAIELMVKLLAAVDILN